MENIEIISIFAYVAFKIPNAIVGGILNYNSLKKLRVLCVCIGKQEWIWQVVKFVLV
jgi:hypothetical protein